MSDDASMLSLVHLVRPPAPGANAPGERPPLLTCRTGWVRTSDSMEAIAPAFDPPFVVVSACSPLVLGPSAFAWFQVTLTPQGPVIAADEAVAGWRLLARFVDEAVAAYHADPALVYLGGFSQGTIMSLATLLTAPEKVAGAVAMSGRLLPEVLPNAAMDEMLRGNPVLIIHGDADDKLGIHLARWAREQLERLRLALTYRELPMGHTITAESLAAATTWFSATLDARRR